jgi:hypothetical protein
VSRNFYELNKAGNEEDFALRNTGEIYRAPLFKEK